MDPDHPGTTTGLLEGSTSMGLEEEGLSSVISTGLCLAGPNPSPTFHLFTSTSHPLPPRWQGVRLAKQLPCPYEYTPKVIIWKLGRDLSFDPHHPRNISHGGTVHQCRRYDTREDTNDGPVWVVASRKEGARQQKMKRHGTAGPQPSSKEEKSRQQAGAG